MEYYLEFEGSESSAREALRNLISSGLSIDFVSGQDEPVSNWVVIANGEKAYSVLDDLDISGSNAQVKSYPKQSYEVGFANQCEVSFYSLNKPENAMVSQTACNAKAIHKEANIKVTCERFRSKHKNEQEALSLLKSKLVARNA